MALDIRERTIEEVTIFDVRGRLTGGENVTMLRDHIKRYLEGGNCRVILNLAEVDYIDSSGLGALVICYTSTKKAGGALKLLKLSLRNIELLILTKLTTVFEIFQDEQDAVNSFYPNRKIQKFDILDFVREQKAKEAGSE